MPEHGFCLRKSVHWHTLRSEQVRDPRFPFESSRPEAFCKKGVFKNIGKFTGKHLCKIFFFNRNVVGLRPATLLRKRLLHRCFPVNFPIFLRTPFLQNTSGDCFCLLKRSFILIVINPLSCTDEEDRGKFTCFSYVFSYSKSKYVMSLLLYNLLAIKLPCYFSPCDFTFLIKTRCHLVIIT